MDEQAIIIDNDPHPPSGTLADYMDAQGKVRPDAPFLNTDPSDGFLKGQVKSRRRVIVKEHRIFLNVTWDDPEVTRYLARLSPPPAPAAGAAKASAAKMLPAKEEDRLSTEPLHLPMFKIDGGLARLIDPASGRTRKLYKFDHQLKTKDGGFRVYLHEDPKTTLTLERLWAEWKKSDGVEGTIADRGFTIFDIPAHGNYIIEDLIGEDEPAFNIIDAEGNRSFKMEGHGSVYWPRVLDGNAGFMVAVTDYPNPDSPDYHEGDKPRFKMILFDSNGKVVETLDTGEAQGEVIQDMKRQDAFYIKGTDSLAYYLIENGRPRLAWKHWAQEFFGRPKGDDRRSTTTRYELFFDSRHFSSNWQWDYLLGTVRRISEHPRGERLEEHEILLDRTGKIVLNKLHQDCIKPWRGNIPIRSLIDKKIVYFASTKNIWGAVFLTGDIYCYRDMDYDFRPLLEEGKHYLKFYDCATQEVIGRYAVQLPDVSQRFSLIRKDGLILWIDDPLPTQPGEPRRSNVEILKLEVVDAGK